MKHFYCYFCNIHIYHLDYALNDLLEELFITLKGLNFRYKEGGKNKSNKHILFIHGLGSSADRWLDIPSALSMYFHTIAIDLLGFGYSDKPMTVDYTIKRFAEFILDFMEQVSIHDGKATLVGHSLGGYIAAEVAIQNRQLIEKLALIDSSGMLEKPTPLLEQYLDAATMNLSYEKVKNVFEQMVADPRLVLPIVINYFIKRMEAPEAKYAFKSAFDNSTSTQIGLHRLKLIEDIPTLIIWGDKDKVIPVKHSEKFKEILKNSQLEIIQDAGHAPFAEKPALVCEMLHSFLSGHGP